MAKQQCSWILLVLLILASKINGVKLSDAPIHIPVDDALVPQSKVSDTCVVMPCAKLPFDSFLLMQVIKKDVQPALLHRGTEMVSTSPHAKPNAKPQVHADTQQSSTWASCPMWMFQKSSNVQQKALANPCKLERNSLLIVLICLLSTISFILCAFAFFRDEKSQDITPLCPQLYSLNEPITFTMPFDTTDDIVVTDTKKNAPICRVTTKWPDPSEPKRPGANSIGATVRISNTHDTTLATVIVKKTQTGQGIALTRTGCEIFGFVEPDGQHEYRVRHRTGIHLLTLVGDFINFDIEGFNPADTKVLTFKQVNGTWTGKIIQNVDAGLVFCCLFAIYTHRKLESFMDRRMEPRKFQPPPTEAAKASTPTQKNKEATLKFPSPSSPGTKASTPTQESKEVTCTSPPPPQEAAKAGTPNQESNDATASLHSSQVQAQPTSSLDPLL